MQGRTTERWMHLCEEAAVEQNPKRLIELIEEITRMLETKEEHRAREQSASGGT